MRDGGKGGIGEEEGWARRRDEGGRGMRWRKDGVG